VLFGALANRSIADHVDFVVVPPGDTFYVFTPGLIGASGCPLAVSRLSISSAYGLAYYASSILGGSLNVMEPNQYYSTNDNARAFRNGLKWVGGSPSTAANARQYFIGFMLGYDGERGNTLGEITAMIDRSVAADGTRPTGTFYFMKTPDTIRSEPRDTFFTAIINSIIARGGQAVQINDVLPAGHQDCLGVLTGDANPAIDSTSMTLLPGSFCDHLTSYAGQFDGAEQVKMSRWIAKGAIPNGASGSMGTVEEPCVFGPNESGKFPHPRLHLWYYQGVCLGEALFRSIHWVPFQCLFYGDPLTQPFAYLPLVSVPDAPGGTVSGTITLSPVATATRPGASISSKELYIDGILLASVNAGGSFSLNTTQLSDGTHDARVLARESGLIATVGRWTGSITTNNFGRTATLGISPGSGDRSTLFTATLSAAGSTVLEIRLLHNARVIGSVNAASGQVKFLGEVVGAGPVRIVAEAEFTDGKRALSAPFLLAIANSNPPAGGSPNHAPVAYNFTRNVTTFSPFLLELPGTDQEDGALAPNILSFPAQSTAVSNLASMVLFHRSPSSAGTDTLTYTYSDGQATSNIGTITLRYSGIAPDVTPPAPNPMQFVIPPTTLSTTEVTMQAALAGDATPPVQYFFDYTSGAGGHDSGWQTSRDYIDASLAPNSFYNYRVKARDNVSPTPNETSYSPTLLGGTAIETPVGISFSGVTATSMVVTATGTLSNPGFGSTGFFFEMTPAAGSGANVWSASTSANITGLTPCTQYSFRVKARNFQATETPYTETFAQTTTGCPACSLLGDVNGSANVNGDDVAGFVRVKLGNPIGGDNPACANYNTGTLAGDVAAFAADLLQ
jgi:hypothetical protein